MINVTVNKVPVAVEPGSTILDAANAAGIRIPTLCDFPGLEKVGSCRVCLVEVQGNPKLLAACTNPVTEGMVVTTNSKRVLDTRKTIVELLVARHPLECTTCTSYGHCSLAELCYELGIKASPYEGPNEEKHPYPLDDANPFIVRDRNKCILCGRCVRVCDKFSQYHAVDFQGRSSNVMVDTAPCGDMEDSDCVFCGQCVAVCPVGALASKTMLGGGAPWKVDTVKTVCSYCGVGCELNVKVNKYSGKISDIVGDHLSPTALNKGRTCVKGRYAWGFVHSDERLTTPLIREDGVFREATWEEAIGRVAEGLKEASAKYGPDSVGFFSSARCTNEENYLLQRLSREVMGTNNVDHCAHL